MKTACYAEFHTQSQKDRVTCFCTYILDHYSSLEWPLQRGSIVLFKGCDRHMNLDSNLIVIMTRCVEHTTWMSNQLPTISASPQAEQWSEGAGH